MSPLLTLDGVNAYYGPIQALHDIVLEVLPGEIVAVIGANGAGKTTLLRSISGVVAPRGGDVRFEGRSIGGLPAEQIVRMGISQVPERRELFGTMTVRENLELGTYHRRRGLTRDALAQELKRVWDLFPILRARDKQAAGTLSGGEQQMLAIARGLMAQPKVLLLDEPSLGLAPLLVQEILRIVGVLRDMGRTVLLVEQNANGALQVADRVYLMEVGRIVQTGTAQELMKDSRIRRAYLGQRVAPPLNLRVSARAAAANAPAETKRGGRSKPAPTKRAATRSRKEHPTMIRQDGGSTPSFTLPDDYFHRRTGYTRGELEALQDAALPRAFAYALESSPFYSHKFEAAGLAAGSIRGLHDLSRLPFTTAEEIRPSPTQAQTSERLVAVGRDATSLIHTSSGTTGSPLIFAYTGRDVMHWAANAATVFWINGFRKSDTILGLMPFGEFTGGGGLYLGMITLGAAYLPISMGAGVTDKALAHLQGKIKMDGHEVAIDPLLHANGLLCLASFLPRLWEMLDESGLRAEDLSLAKIGAGAEPSSDAVRLRIAERFGVWPRDNYGLGEFFGPGVAGECEVGGGLHVLSDAFIAEVIDPETGEPTPQGQMGELVLTGLEKEALPLFRYRTGDRVMALPQACPCGSAHTWISRVPGRIDVDDMLIPGGVVIHRTYLENILLNVDGSGAEYVATVADHPTRKGLRRLHIAIEGDTTANVAETIQRRIQIEYNHTPVVTVLPPGTLPRSYGKAKRILSSEDYRALIE